LFFQDQLIYIDLFSAAGKGKVKEDGRVLLGSPLIALEVGGFDRYILCEESRKRMKALRARVAASYSDRDVVFVSGDANSKVDEIIGHVPMPRKGRTVLSLCLVDPFGLKDLQFATIREMSSRRYMDFLVLVPSGYDANRNKWSYLF
jgi:three-Cys-motif partner protein